MRISHIVKMAKLPPLNTLRCFEAAARHKSFSRAAEELHITQSAVSHQVRQLEEWFSVKLFLRQGRKTEPTATGLDFAVSIAEAFALIQDATRRLKTGENKPTLTVAVLPSIATIWIIPRLEGFFSANPEVPVKMVYSIHGQQPNFQDVDLAITWGTEPPADVVSTPLLPGECVAVANPSYAAKIDLPHTAQTLLHVTLLHDTDRQGWQKFMRKAGLKQTGLVVGPVFEDFNMLRAAALAGQGLALCPRSVILDDVKAGRLVELFPAIRINEDHGYWLIEPRDDDKRGRHSVAFKSWLLQQAKELLRE